MVRVAGDEKSVEASVAFVHEVEGGQIGVGEVFFVSEVELLAPWAARWIVILRKKLFTVSGARDAQGRQAHIVFAGEVAADLFGEALGQPVDIGAVELHFFFRGVVAPIAVVRAHSGGVNPGFDA